MPIWRKIGMQNNNSPLMEHLTFFHDHTILLLTLITVITMTMITLSLYEKNFNRFILESHQTELFWTSIPAFLLIFIAVPSMKTLYIMEEIVRPILSIKAIAYQWNWSYEYSNMISKMISSNISNSIKMRLRAVSNSLVVPTMSPTRMMITSKDVLHSWTIPSLGLKADATPGRINQAIVIIKRPRVILGQCSEICGAGHSFIPIILEAPTMKKFVDIY